MENKSIENKLDVIIDILSTSLRIQNEMINTLDTLLFGIQDNDDEDDDCDCCNCDDSSCPDNPLYFKEKTELLQKITALLDEYEEKYGDDNE